MSYLCPVCGSPMSTDDLYIYTCLNCDEIFTIDELNEEYGLSSSCSTCHVDNED